ncbi:hypothetical protein B0H16DRAFT_1740132 [Mycena metata]|uniref:Uncharacterized protein n=1 Tax=Mycena metata TaxID=1033252 RepID=A0AAD7MHV2_9AGAR|nr:hypothetical protein B0H16DRAFT_1740132 [Mycena metata]
MSNYLDIELDPSLFPGFSADMLETMGHGDDAEYVYDPANPAFSPTNPTFGGGGYGDLSYPPPSQSLQFARSRLVEAEEFPASIPLPPRSLALGNAINLPRGPIPYEPHQASREAEILPMVACLNELLRPPPLLRQLTWRPAAPAHEIATCTAFESAPLLRSVSIHGQHDSPPLPLTQLVQLRFRVPRTPEIFASLEGLRDLTLMGSRWPLSYPNPIKLPNLRMLFVKRGQYLSLFVLPALEDLCVRDHPPDIVDFIDRSSCRLKKLTILSDVPDILPFLRRTPTLEELRLNSPSTIKVIISALTVTREGNDDADSNLVCPELRHVSLFGLKEQNDIITGAEMVCSRERSTRVSSLFLSLLDKSWMFCSSQVLSTSGVEVFTGVVAVGIYEAWLAEYPGSGE